MTRPSRFAFALLWVVSQVVAGPAPLAERYASRLAQAIAACRAQVPAMVAPAERAAVSLAAGGQLYALGSLPGFDIEALGRAGGLGMLQRVTPKTTWRAGGVALYGLLGSGLASDVETIRQLRAQGVLVVAFGSPGEAAAAADAWLNTGVVDHGLAVVLPSGLRTAPLDGVVSVANLWAFTGELVSALTRLGKMPVILQSVFLEGARERNAALRARPFDERQAIAPVPPGCLGTAYLDRLAEHIGHLRTPEVMTAVDRGATLAVEARRKGQTAWVWMFGHWPPFVPGTPGDPGVWRPLGGKVTPEAVAARLRQGDVLLHIGYTDIEVPVLTAAKAAGASTIAVVAGRVDGPPPSSELPTVWLDPHWILGDADVAVDGYDTRLLPPSGAVGVAVYWMLTAEVAGRG